MAAHLKPRSSVIPRAMDSGFLSRDAVESSVESDLTREVFPLSTCPKTPTFTFRTFSGERSGGKLAMFPSRVFPSAGFGLWEQSAIRLIYSDTSIVRNSAGVDYIYEIPKTI